MAVVTLTSAAGAPGASTTALALALHWLRDVVLVDADPCPAQVVEAGYLRGTSTVGRGLSALTQVHREHRDLAQELWAQLLPLSRDESATRHFLPGFSHAGSADVFAAVWPDLADALSGLDGAGFDAVVDAGRCGPGLPAPLLRRTSLLAVVCRSSLRSLAAVRLHLPGMLDQVDAQAPGAQVGLVVVGPGRPYSNADISAQFGVPVLASVAWDPAGAAVLSDGEPEPRRFAGSALSRSWHAAASTLASSARATAQLTGAPR